MPIKDYSTTAANNTLTPPNGAPEGMAAGLVNNTIRQVMADTRLFYESGGWCDLGHVPTYVSATSFTIPTDVTAYYTVGRRIRFYGTIMGTFYGYIVSSAFSSPNTTVTVVLDSGALTSNLSRVDLSFFEQLTTGPLRQGGYINFFRNPFMEVAQRGSSGTTTAGVSTYSLDGWAVFSQGAGVTWQQAGPVSGGDVYALNSLGLLGAAGVTNCLIYHRIESGMAAQFAGKRVTVQFLISNQTGAALTPSFNTYIPPTTDTYTAATTDLAAVNLQTIPAGSQARVAYTFNTTTLATRGYGMDLSFGGQLNGAGKNVFISAADIRFTPDAPLGLNNAPPRPEYRPSGPETILNQRYLFSVSEGNSGDYPAFGQIQNPILAQCAVVFPVNMRSLASFAGIVGGFNVWANQTQYAISSFSGGQGSITTGRFECVISGAITGQACHLRGNNGTGRLLFSAEL